MSDSSKSDIKGGLLFITKLSLGSYNRCHASIPLKYSNAKVGASAGNCSLVGC